MPIATVGNPIFDTSGIKRGPVHTDKSGACGNGGKFKSIFRKRFLRKVRLIVKSSGSRAWEAGILFMRNFLLLSKDWRQASGF